MFSNKLKASNNPIEAIGKVSYAGQAQNLKNYRYGYEQWFNEMPDIQANLMKTVASENYTKEQKEQTIMQHGVTLSGAVLDGLAVQLQQEEWIKQPIADGTFKRTILALEEPTQLEDGSWKAGSQVIVAQWGKGFRSPVHGHATGLLYENLLIGKVKLNTYRITEMQQKESRLVSTEILNSGVFALSYTPENEDALHERATLVHNFEAVEYTASLHFVPEYNRDGRDNRFVVEYFENTYKLTPADVTQIGSEQAMYLHKGAVVLVRSTNVPEYGDHFIVITGMPVMKEHGLRPQDVAIEATHQSSELLDKFPAKMGLRLLKLNKEAEAKFHKFHGIKYDSNGKVIFPTA